jgi:methylaspartate ammonia-lyase
MQSVEARAVTVVDMILRVLLVLPHVLFLAHAFEEASSVKDRAKLITFILAVFKVARVGMTR